MAGALLKDKGEEVLQYWNLLNALIYPYKYLCIMYITSDIFLWHRRPLDNDTLHRKFEIFFKTTKQIHNKLLKIWPDSESESIVSLILFSSSIGFSKSYIEEMLERFEEYGLSGSVEPVLDVLWKISYPILPLVDPSSYNEHLKNGTLKDWRAVLKDDPESKYRPRTERLPFDEQICITYLIFYFCSSISTFFDITSGLIFANCGFCCIIDMI